MVWNKAKQSSKPFPMEIRQAATVCARRSMSGVTITVMLVMLIVKAVDSVHITRLSVPRVYVLDNYHRQRHQHHQYYAPGQVSARDDPDIPFDPAEPLLRAPDPAEHLVLDCEYVIEPHETGFVLKWLHNDVPIYQWIPPHRSPSSLNRMRDHVNRTFTVGNEAMHKHRALALMHPSQDFAGKYSCSVHTYQSFDIKSADLFIIVPESGFVLKYHRNLNDLVTVVCSVYGIFPAPELSLWINDYRLENGTVYEIPVADGLYDSSVSVQLVLYESLQPDDVIKCMLAVPGTEYRRAKETVFVDVNSRPFGESNSILDPFGTVAYTSSSTSSSSTTVKVSTSSTPSVTVPVTTPEATSVKVTTTVTTTAGQQPSSSAVAGTASSKDTVRPQIPSVIRLRPTASSTRVLTVQQSNAVDSDEIMNVLDFKELLNENLLYNSGTARLELHRLRFVVWAGSSIPLLHIGQLLLVTLRRWQMHGS